MTTFQIALLVGWVITLLVLGTLHRGRTELLIYKFNRLEQLLEEIRDGGSAAGNALDRIQAELERLPP